MKKVELVEGLQTIGEFSFAQSGLLEITIPKSVVTICEGAFSKCKNLKTVTFADGSQLKEIGKEAFSECVNVKTITLPNMLQTVKNSCFASSCLIEIQIPNSVKVVEDKAFYKCESLEKIVLSQNMETISK